MTSRRRRSLLRAISPQRRSPPSRSLGPSLMPRLLPHQPKPRGKLPHTNGLPPTGRRRVPRRRPRLPFTPLPRPKSLRGRLSQRHFRLLDLQRLRIRRRPRTCLRQSARRESQAPKRRARLLRTHDVPLLSGLQWEGIPTTSRKAKWIVTIIGRFKGEKLAERRTLNFDALDPHHTRPISSSQLNDQALSRRPR